MSYLFGDTINKKKEGRENWKKGDKDRRRKLKKGY
jgi:hypothetical protein